MDQIDATGISGQLAALLERQRRAFMADPLPTAQFRRDNLTKLETVVKRRKNEIVDAMQRDFGSRPAFESVMAEILPTLAGIKFARKHLGGWMKPQSRKVDINFQPATNRVEFKPLGVIGIVAPWNYPIYLTLGPLVDALAAGNRVMIKPSEFTPVTSQLLKSLLAEIFTEDEVAVLPGDVALAKAFCALPFDHLVYTGSTNVGRDVMRSAAENLVPVTLELGGKSPVILGDDYDVNKAADTVAFGKFFNAGQTCVAPDYALVAPGKADAFAARVIAAANTMYPKLSGNGDYTAIIADRHHQRLTDILAEAESLGAKVIRHQDAVGARGNVRHFAPTVVLDPPLDSRLMREEIFGPILPVVRSNSLDDSINFVNARPRPLALYAFTKDAATERKILDRTISGGVTINGTMLHVAQDDMGFGGVGPSGMGSYHGHEGFLRFSHARGIHKIGFFSGLEFLKPPYKSRAAMAMKFIIGYTGNPSK